MMERPPRGRPRRVSTTQRGTEIHQSNSTAIQFLGGRQKSWMQNPGAAPPVLSPPSRQHRPYPTPANSVDTPVADSRSSTLNVNASDTLQTPAVSLSSSEKSLVAPVLLETQSSAETALLTSHATAPIEGRNHDPQTVESSGNAHARSATGESSTEEGHCERGQPEPPSANSANGSEPTSAMEPENRHDNSIDDHDVRVSSSSDAHQNKRPRIEHPLPARPSQGRSQRIIPPKRRAGNCTEQPVPVRPSQIHSQQIATPNEPPENRSTTQEPQPRPMESIYNLQGPSLEKWKPSLPPAARVRVCLLQDAYAAKDFQYLALQQLYCLSTVSPESLRRLSGFGIVQEHAFHSIAQLLYPNSNLPLDFVKKCAELPGPIETFKHYPSYWSALEHVLTKILGRVFARWDKFETAILSRGFPPLIDEVTFQFATSSLILVRVIFLACARRLTGNRHCEATKRFDEIYEINLKQYLPREKPRQVLDAMVENEYVLGLYSDLLLQRYKAGTTNLARSPVRATPSCLMLEYARQPSQSGARPANSEQRVGQNPQTGPSTAQARTGSSQTAQPAVPATSVSTHAILPSNNAPAPEAMDRTRQLPVQGVPLNRPTQLNSTGNIGCINATSGVQFQQQRASPASTIPVGPSQVQQVPRLPSNGFAHPTGIPSASHSPAMAPYIPQAHPVSTPLVPPVGFTRPEDNVPQPTRTGLHEAHLIVSTRHLNQQRNQSPSTRLLQYQNHFAVAPFCLGNQLSNFICTLHLPRDEFHRLAQVFSASKSQRISYGLLDGCRTYQLRCIRVGSPTEELTREKWFESDCTWPEAIYIHVNDTEHYVRRKTYNGKDLPVNITCSLREGQNQIKLTYLRGPAEFTKVFYAVALEVLETVELERLRAAIHKISAPVCLEGIKGKLERSAKNDDELSIVDDHLTIGLIDPFMARICNIPVRSMSCAHWECFDLETYLDTRLTKTVKELGMPEIWKCPICQKDARPQRLFINEFLIDVRTELEKRDLLESTQAILVKRDGSWQPKMESSSGHDRNSKTPALSKNDSNESRYQGQQEPSGQLSSSAAKNVPVIELD